MKDLDKMYQQWVQNKQAEPTAKTRDLEDQARNIVLRQLSAAPKTRHQLAEKLREKEIPDEIIDPLLDRYEEVQLINDADFAHAWVKTRHRSKKLARRAISRELSEKGIDRGLAEDALAQIDENDEWASAMELVEKRLRRETIQPLSSPEDRKERDKLIRRLVGMLARKGYNPSMAFSVVNTALSEAEENI